MTRSLSRSCPEFSDSDAETEISPFQHRFTKVHLGTNTIMSKQTALSPAKALAFLKFVDASPTPFHAVHTAISHLSQAGFKPISARADLSTAFKSGDIVPGGKYYQTRNQSSLLAFVVPRRLTERTGFSVVAGHTDSPCLKIRPVSKKEKAGYVMVNTETYGGGAWPSWFDRDLGLAGRVIIKRGTDQFESKLIHIERPILRIPTLGECLYAS
jgi:aspartyl aminopeptidase